MALRIFNLYSILNLAASYCIVLPRLKIFSQNILWIFKIGPSIKYDLFQKAFNTDTANFTCVVNCEYKLNLAYRERQKTTINGIKNGRK